MKRPSKVTCLTSSVMFDKKLFSFWLQSPHLNPCSVCSALPWHWLLLHSPLSDHLIVMMLSHLGSGLLLLLCVCPWWSSQNTHTHTYTYKHTCALKSTIYVSCSPFLYSLQGATLYFPLSLALFMRPGENEHPLTFAETTLCISHLWTDEMSPCTYLIQSILFLINLLSISYKKNMAKWAEKFCSLSSSPSLASGKGASYNTSFPPLSRLVETWEVMSSCHCHQKSCSIWQTETDGLLLREACFVDTVQPEGPKHHFGVVIGNMIEREARRLVNLTFTGVLKWSRR